MATTLLAGAGAEVDLGLPSGTDYLVDTYFTKKSDLYDALREYYGCITAGDHLFPPYQKEFLFNRASCTFTQLLENLGNDFIASVLKDTPVEELGSSDKLSNKQRESLFKRLIESNESPLKAQETGSIHNRNYYGILESLFSCLLNPKDSPAKFWRLINFYWSAYFSIVMPLLQTNFAKSRGIEPSYTYALNNLGYISDTIDSDEFWMSLNKDSYYHTADRAFDYVLTTNYTPFCKHLAKQPDENVIFLSGSILQFESAGDFELHSPKDASGIERKVQCPFPFIMTKAPIKPIINVSEINAFTRAIKILGDTDRLVVLGYSFNQDDAHICALVRNYLRASETNKVIYFAHGKDEERTFALTQAKLKEELRKSLRVTERIIEDQCEIECITDYRSESFVSLIKSESDKMTPVTKE